MKELVQLTIWLCKWGGLDLSTMVFNWHTFSFSFWLFGSSNFWIIQIFLGGFSEVKIPQRLRFWVQLICLVTAIVHHDTLGELITKVTLIGTFTLDVFRFLLMLQSDVTVSSNSALQFCEKKNEIEKTKQKISIAINSINLLQKGDNPIN